MPEFPRIPRGPKIKNPCYKLSKICIICNGTYTLIEGSLEVKFPIIWTDEKQSREEAERRERLEERRLEEDRRCRCEKR
jgi:hypothetical protein